MTPLSTDTPQLRRRILDEARRLLLAEGYTRLSMRRLAREIGYSPTSIYLHFQNKDALFHALIDEGMDRLYDALRATEASGPDDPVERLAALCRAYVRFGLDNGELYEVMFLLHPEHMDRYPAEKYRRARRNLDLFARALAAGAEAERLWVPQPRVAASVVWAALHGAVSLLLARRLDVRIEPEAFVETAVAHALYGFSVREGQPAASS